MLFEFDQHSVFDADAERMDVIGALVLRLVHQLVGALEQFLRELPRDRPPLGDVAQHQADDADIYADRLLGKPRILARPVMNTLSIASINACSCAAARCMRSRIH